MGGVPLTLTRSLLGVFIPGIVAASAWLVLIADKLPDLSDFYERYTTLGNLLLFSTITITGLIVSGCSSYFEKRWDLEREAEFSQTECWFAYLAQDSEPAPVGHRHISRLASNLYFELGMMIAAPTLTVGVMAVGIFARPAIGHLGIAVLAVLSMLLPYSFRRLARDTHEALCRTRKELVLRRGSPNSMLTLEAPIVGQRSPDN